jgi:hypothetical protein
MKSLTQHNYQQLLLLLLLLLLLWRCITRASPQLPAAALKPTAPACKQPFKAPVL